MVMETPTKGILYIVATPIGNLEDITIRALRILREVGLIAAEDTRRTKNLLSAHRIDTPLTSLHAHNERQKSELLISKLSEGTDIAYVSDAGTPGISDPGYFLINRAIERGVKVVPIPGVSAVTTALSVSGFPMDTFVFFGFLPSKESRRRSFLYSIKEEEKTLVFYESPKRLLHALHDMEIVFGDREVVVTRELTKVFEEIIRGRLSQIMEMLKKRAIKGEITIIVKGQREKTPDRSDDEIRECFLRLRNDPRLSQRDIIERISEELDIPKKRAYRLVLEHEDLKEE